MKYKIYFETSALVKKYIANEEGSENIRSLFELTSKNSNVIYSSSVITRAEVYAALGSALRGRKLTKRNYQNVRSYFDMDWQTFETYEVNNDLSNYAAYLTTKTQCRLKGADSIQLATAVVSGANLLVNCDKDINQYVKNSSDIPLCLWDPIKEDISAILELKIKR